MTQAEFKAWPYLLTRKQVAACGYTYGTQEKYAEHGILQVVQPKGCLERRFQKRQLAQLLNWLDAVDVAAWAREKPLLPPAAVSQWTGYTPRTIHQIVAAGGLVAVQPGGIGNAKYRKEEVGGWLGL